MTPLLSIDHLRVTFSRAGERTTAVDDVSLYIAEGQSVGIVGESGSGKSTLAKSLLGLLPGGKGTGVEGQLRLRGMPMAMSAVPRLRGKLLAMVFQDPLSFLDPLMPVGRQIREVVVRRDAAARGGARTGELLQLVRLPPAAAAAYPHELSGGMRQRALLAIALACRPELLVADEPTTALDVTTQKEILDLIRDIRVELNMALLLISHDLAIVSTLCDTVNVMHRGKIIESGKVRQVFRAPEHEYSRILLSAARATQIGRTKAQTMASGSRPVLEISGVCKSFLNRTGTPRQVLDEVDLRIFPGETVALVGESGSGKSTLARAALGLLRPDQGKVCLLGQSLYDAAPAQLRRLRTNMHPVFQDSSAAFNPRHNLRQLLAEALASKGIATGLQRQRAIALLDQVRLRPGEIYLDRYPHELSGGQRQRLAIARALATEPALIIADEPLSGADVSIRGAILELLDELQVQRKLSYLFITHDIWLARAFAHRVAVMFNGAIVEQGAAEAVIDSPRHPYTQRLVASVPVVDFAAAD